MKSLVTFNNVKKRYGKVWALNGVNFELKRNDFVALIGNNGCGKTTTVNIICNIINYNTGNIYVEDQALTSNYVSYKSKLGIVLSEPYYIDDFNIVEYWRFVCKFQKIPKDQVSKRIKDILLLLDLENDRKKRIRQLSSGNKMKVTLGAALLHNPEILILDEPFIHLDIKATQNVISILKSFKNKKTLFITSHNLDLVADLCDTFLIMENGKISLELNKSDYDSTENLKNKVKEMLAKENIVNDISWLSL